MYHVNYNIISLHTICFRRCKKPADHHSRHKPSMVGSKTIITLQSPTKGSLSLSFLTSKLLSFPLSIFSLLFISADVFDGMLEFCDGFCSFSFDDESLQQTGHYSCPFRPKVCEYISQWFSTTCTCTCYIACICKNNTKIYESISNKLHCTCKCMIDFEILYSISILRINW